MWHAGFGDTETLWYYQIFLKDCGITVVSQKICLVRFRSDNASMVVILSHLWNISISGGVKRKKVVRTIINGVQLIYDFYKQLLASWLVVAIWIHLLICGWWIVSVSTSMRNLPPANELVAALRLTLNHPENIRCSLKIIAKICNNHRRHFSKVGTDKVLPAPCDRFFYGWGHKGPLPEYLGSLYIKLD